MPVASKKQREVLKIISDFGSECWGDVWSHCDYLHWGVRGTELASTANALKRKGFISENDYGIEITAAGRAALEAK